MVNPSFSRRKSLLFLSLLISIGLYTPALQGMSAVQYAYAACTNLYQATLDYSRKNHVTALLSAAVPVGVYYYYHLAQSYKPLQWNWNTLNYTTPQQFPASFLWGTGTSAHQVEGNCTNNTWALWEQEKDAQGNPCVQASSGLACDHWNRYKEDIQLMKKLGVNSYRFSLEWSKIEPQEGMFDQAALSHYADVCQELLNNGIQPCITIHHYTDPIWFMKKGGFEHQENIQYYVRFATLMIKHLHRFNPLWFTFNSPDGYAAQAYLTCTKPAGRIPLTKDMQLFAHVYANVLEAHVQTYRAIKKDSSYTSARIGILKNMFQLDPYRTYNPLDMLACSMGKKLVDDPFFAFFTQGIFAIYVPFKAYIKHVNAHAQGALDFIGVNYYSHGYMSFFKVISHPDEEKTNNERYTIYAEGLYRAIVELSEKVAKPLNIPLYVTENGVACGDDESKRTVFLQKYLYALSHTIQDGHDVRGYFYWSFMNNYEWGTYSKQYGLYKVNFETQERTLRPGSQFYIDTIAHNTQAHKSSEQTEYDHLLCAPMYRARMLASAFSRESE